MPSYATFHKGKRCVLTGEQRVVPGWFGCLRASVMVEFPDGSTGWKPATTGELKMAGIVSGKATAGALNKIDQWADIREAVTQWVTSNSDHVRSTEYTPGMRRFQVIFSTGFTAIIRPESELLCSGITFSKWATCGGVSGISKHLTHIEEVLTELENCK